MTTWRILTALLGLATAALLLAGCPAPNQVEAPQGSVAAGGEPPVAPAPEPESDPQPAPAFTLKTPGGGEVSLADYAGKILVLDFWSTSCTACIEEMPEFKALYEGWDHERVEYLAVSLDTSIDVVERFREDHPELDVPMALADNQMLDDYLGGRLVIPQSRVIGPDGRLLYKFGPGPSAAQVEAAVEALLAEQDSPGETAPTPSGE